MRLGRNSCLVLLSYNIIVVPVTIVNILNIVLAIIEKSDDKVGFLGMTIQGCFYAGCLIGTLIAPSLLSSLSPVKVLIVSTLLAILSPIVYPEIKKDYQVWIKVSILILLLTLSGIGVMVFQLTHCWILIKTQQINKRSWNIGLRNGLMYVSGIIAGLLICFPEVSETVDPWLLCVFVGVCGFAALLVIVTIKDEEIIISINQGITLHNLSYFLSYFSIGTYRAIAYGYLPYKIYLEIKESSVMYYTLGVYLIFISASFLLGALFTGICIKFKKEKWLIITCISLGVLALVPLILEQSFNGLTTISVLTTLISSLFSLQCGMLETFIIKIIAVNTRKPKIQILMLKGITSATSAAFFFAGFFFYDVALLVSIGYIGVITLTLLILLKFYLTRE